MPTLEYAAALAQLVARAAVNIVAPPPPPPAPPTPPVNIIVPREAGTGAGTYPVAGTPANFPDTRANWDILLEQYNYNVLQRKPPRL
jgi:hypothetical protein